MTSRITIAGSPRFFIPGTFRDINDVLREKKEAKEAIISGTSPVEETPVEETPVEETPTPVKKTRKRKTTT